MQGGAGLVVMGWTKGRLVPDPSSIVGTEGTENGRYYEITFKKN